MSELLLEDGRLRNVIRTIVKDLVTIYKEEDEGEFYLPNYLYDDIDTYNFPKFEHDVVVQFNMVENYDIDDYKTDGQLWRNDSIIEITVEYNPDKKFDILYELLGELNQLVAHELRHIYQEDKNLFDLNTKEKTNPFKYYTQPHEIDAQIFGFNRLAKLSKRPFETIVRNWFDKNKDIHKLNKNETQKVINIILTQNNEKSS